MKTYIVPVHQKDRLEFIAVLANNKTVAYNKVKAKYKGARKTGITESAVYIDYVSCKKI